jgi:hypothetical protein
MILHLFVWEFVISCYVINFNFKFSLCLSELLISVLIPPNAQLFYRYIKLLKIWYRNNYYYISRLNRICSHFISVNNRNGDALISVFVSSVVNRGFEPWSDQTKEYNICICCFSGKHTVQMSKRVRTRLFCSKSR